MEFVFHDGRTGEIPDDQFLRIDYVAIAASEKGLVLALGTPDQMAPDTVAMQGFLVPNHGARWLVEACVALTKASEKPSWLQLQ